MNRKYLLLGVVVALFVATLGCRVKSDNPSTSGSVKGAVSVSLTDASAYGIDHVWITVSDLWFHTSSTAEPGQTGWVKFPLSSPLTLDLLTLNNGAISAPVWDNVELPEGDYTQMRVFLVRTDAALTDSAGAESLQFNNQVDVTGDGTAYPLRVPAADRGIMLTGQFSVKKNEKLKLAVDFDAGHDVVKVDRNGHTEYILKPRLAYFDLDNAGAIKGSIAAPNLAAGQFVIKAEQLAPNGVPVHIVRRATILKDAFGNFTLYPLFPGSYDIVIRGVGHETVVIKNVPVVKGTTPQSNPTVIPTVGMTQANTPDFALNATIVSPTGAWIDLFQTIPGESAPYEIRFSHFNPLTGQIIGFPLSSDPLRVGAYVDNTSIISLATVTPVEGAGGYRRVAGAPLYNLELGMDVYSAASGTLEFGTLSVTYPATAARTVTGSLLFPETLAAGTFDNGVVFACHGGIIVNAVKLNNLATDPTYSLGNLPGGTPESPLPGAFYGIEAFAWSTSDASKAIAIPRPADLSTADATGADLTMEMLP